MGRIRVRGTKDPLIRAVERTNDTQHRMTTAEFDAQIWMAEERHAADREAGVRATAARYDDVEKRVLVQLSNGYLIGIPMRAIPELARATTLQLAEVAVSPAGSGLHWEALDVDLSVPALVMSAIPDAQRMREMGRLAGRVRSEAKSAASRANGAKGGRPRSRPTLK